MPEPLVKLDLDVVRRQIASRFASASQLLDGWPALQSAEGSKSSRARPGYHLARWLNGVTFPRSRDELFGLAAALDADPLALLAMPANMTWVHLCDAVRSYNWTPRLAPAVQRFWFLRELIEPAAEWPSADVALEILQTRGGNKAVYCHRVSHRHNYYASFTITCGKDAPNQVWHFAWRAHSGLPWRPYGFVRLEQAGIHLYGFDGREAAASLEGGASFTVETWFGRDDADFCLASLHENECSLSDRGSPGMTTVRFRKASFHLPRL